MLPPLLPEPEDVNFITQSSAEAEEAQFIQSFCFYCHKKWRNLNRTLAEVSHVKQCLLSPVMNIKTSCVQSVN